MAQSEEVPNFPPDTHKKSNFQFIVSLSSIFFVLIVVSMIFLNGNFFKKNSLNQNTSNGTSNGNSPTFPLPKSTSEKMPDWVKPESSTKGFVFIDAQSRKFYIYKFKDNKLQVLQIDPLWGSEAAGTGQSSPFTSPDMLYTAYIDSKDYTLQLMSNETFEHKPVTSEAVSMITAWSPNSKKIVYYIGEDNVETRKQGQVIDYNKPEQFIKGRHSGFYLFNIDTGETVSLYPLKATDVFMDNDRLISVQWTGPEQPVKSIVFNTSTFTAYYNDVKPSKSSIGQYNFKDNGTYWTFSYSKDPTL